MRLRRLALSGSAVLTAVLGLVLGLAVVPAHADPTTIGDAKAQLERLDKEQSEIGEQYDEVKLRLTAGRAKVAVLRKDIAAQQAKVDVLRRQATTVALVQFQSRGVDPTIQLAASSEPEAFLNQMSTARKVDENMNTLLQDFQAQQANLADLQRSAEAEVAALAGEEQRLRELDAQLKVKVEQGQAVLDRLTEEERLRLNGSGISRDEARQALEGSALVDGPADSRALAAVRYAVSKVPYGNYVWGAEGPTNFDCSGLMLAAYRTVGISLPHSSRAQWGVGRPVSRSQLKPGDLLFFYSPIHHVGMYMGNGLFVHARNPRNDLEITRLNSYPEYQGARRVVG